MADGRMWADRSRAHGIGADRLPRVTPEEIGQLQHQLHLMQQENELLRQQLGQHEQTKQTRADRRNKVVRGSGRLLIPLLDRHKVVRSFGSLAETAADFSGPRDAWPERDRLLADARGFLEALVRFAVRRRTLLLVFSLLASLIPIIQIWLVVQQNEIIRNQNEFFEIQVYDIVARSMTQGDRNARLMTGALLSRAEPAFLAGVIEESFEPNVTGLFRAEAVEARTRRLEDAAFRGYLAQAVVRNVQKQVSAKGVTAEVTLQSVPMLRSIVRDAGDRVYQVLRLGENAKGVDDELAEQVDGYLVKAGEAMRVYARLARDKGTIEEFYKDIEPYLRRVSGLSLEGNHFRKAHVFALEALLFELAAEPEPGDPEVDLQKAGLTPEEAHAKGLEALKSGVGGDDVDWDGLAKQMEPS
ncbi:MAG: hypothetical protein AAF799_44620 [Myxococcota bacterium]